MGKLLYCVKEYVFIILTFVTFLIKYLSDILQRMFAFLK